MTGRRATKDEREAPPLPEQEGTSYTLRQNMVWVSLISSIALILS